MNSRDHRNGVGDTRRPILGTPDDFTDLAGTSITVADDDDNQLVVVEVAKPRKRHLRRVVSRATQNSTIDSIVASQNASGVEPVMHDATTVVGSEFHHAPAEGAA